MTLPMHGTHNILNSLAAIAVATELDITSAQIKTALAKFQGIKRRFTKTGIAGGITIIDDYAHHPVEIQAVLSAARDALNNKGRLIVVAQPHRYTRLADLFESFSTCFEQADTIIIADIFTAGEDPIAGASRKDLVTAIKKTGKSHVMELDHEDHLPDLIHDIAKSGDMVLCLGAGSITHWANDLPKNLDLLMAKAQKHSA
jgi:UDP-N-acetylmuramate--alanine ligase